jgi:serine/threonine protein phosphatase 1
MNYFIIGDIHGCYYTFNNMLTHWNPASEYLVLVGDLIDRGNFSAGVVRQCMELMKENERVVIIKGNHEAEFIEHVATGYNANWMAQRGQKTLDNFAAADMDLVRTAAWMRTFPLKLEQEGLVVTHGGISHTAYPFDENNNDGVLWNRQPLKNIGKVQVHGHTPLKRRDPAYDALANAWNIDTGAVYGYGLTGLRLDARGNLLAQFFEATDQRDIM